MFAFRFFLSETTPGWTLPLLWGMYFWFVSQEAESYGINSHYLLLM